MKKLKNVSLICVDCYNVGAAISAIQNSLKQINFERVILFTDTELEIDGIEVIQIDRICSKREYSEFMIKKINKYISTDYFMVIQADGYIIDGSAWDDRYLEFDYIGASWVYDNDRQVGNGGASLRSKNLHTILANDEEISVLHPEDQSICILYKYYLEEKYGIKFAPVELADKFSYECKEPVTSTFAFHGYFHQPFAPTIILKRTSALGDCIIAEPVMRYYAVKGYNVVLDIPMEYYQLFKEHYFPLKHISQFDSGRIPAKTINLDLAYEVKPRQSYLKSYFEFCGIKDYKLSRPQLFPLESGETKYFKKYVVIHIDERETPHRNILGVNWVKVQRHLEALGYTVIQVGKASHYECGLFFNTAHIRQLKFLIAGCDLFLGVDSAPSHIAMAYNKKCLLFFGSVNPDYIHPDLSNTVIIQQKCIYQNCWHLEGGTSGQDCRFNKNNPPCCISSYEEVIDGINKLISL